MSATAARQLAPALPGPPGGGPDPQSLPQKTDWTPTAKVSVGVLAGAITMVVCAFLAPHWKSWTSQEMSPAIGAAFTNILTFIIQYMMPDRRAST